MRGITLRAPTAAAWVMAILFGYGGLSIPFFLDAPLEFLIVVAIGAAVPSLGVLGVAIGASLVTRTLNRFLIAAAIAHISSQAILLYSAGSALGCPPVGSCVNVLLYGFLFSLVFIIAATVFVAVGLFYLLRPRMTGQRAHDADASSP